jgi:multicomponent Na+:H+ antiporter subunit A
MLFAVLSGFLLAAFTPFIHQLVKSRIGWILALYPAGLTFFFASSIPVVYHHTPIRESWNWIPSMGIQLGFSLDGLSLLFALLISFIGTFILIYAGSYLKGHPYLNRFYVTLLLFMAAMLGVVLSDNLISLFVFWELTSVTSYMLIGFNHEDPKARKSALQGLFVTVGGGLVLMAGLIMLGLAGDSYTISTLLSQSDSLLSSSMATGMVICIMIGAFTKSAQFPFHFWLPNAMAAPTPVSAYLHSATMVKAGVYLLARLSPILGTHIIWETGIPIIGSITMLLGAYMAYAATDIKKVLAYSTIMALGTLTMLIGIGSPIAITAFVCFLLAHSLYKGALFMIAGIIDHETGTKDILSLGGLRKKMPITMIATAVVALSLAGLPPLFGFIAKELMFEGILGSGSFQLALLTAAVLSAIFISATAGVLVFKPFFGAQKDTPKKAHEAPLALLLGPCVLGIVSLLFGVFPALISPIISSAGTAISGTVQHVHLGLWHGFNVPLGLSAISLLGGILFFSLWSKNRKPIAATVHQLSRLGPEAGYYWFMDALTRVSRWQTHLLQNGKTGIYLIILVLSTVGLVGYTLLSKYGIHLHLDVKDIYFYEWFIAALMVIASLYVISTRSRLGAVATMGVVGFTVSLIFVMFSAPDLGITQILVETLTVILLVLVLFRLPGFSHFSSKLEVLRDVIVAISFGTLMTLLTLAAIDVQFFPSISEFYIQNSYLLAHGRNIVNVIIVDFRALDTLGEIFVFAIVALGVLSMLKLRGSHHE